jgi:adenylate cyclase
MRLALVHMHRGELRAALPIAKETLPLAERLGDALLLGQADHTLGITHLYLGDLALARRHLGEALALYDPERDRVRAALYGSDICTVCHAWLSFVLWLQGFPDGALRHADEAIAAARPVHHPLSEAFALAFTAQLHQLRGDMALCRKGAEAALALASQQALPYWAAVAMVLGGWALVKEGQAEQGLARLRSGLDAYCATGAKVRRPEWLALLAEAYLDIGRIEEGSSALREALAEVEKTASGF